MPMCTIAIWGRTIWWHHWEHIFQSLIIFSVTLSDALIVDYRFWNSCILYLFLLLGRHTSEIVWMVGWCHQGEVDSLTSVDCFLKKSEAASYPPHSRPSIYHPYRWSPLSSNEYNCIHTFVILLVPTNFQPMSRPYIVFQGPDSSSNTSSCNSSTPSSPAPQIPVSPAQQTFFPGELPDAFVANGEEFQLFSVNTLRNRCHKKIRDPASSWANHSYYVAYTIYFGRSGGPQILVWI